MKTWGLAIASLTTLALHAGHPAVAAEPKYYFQTQDVKAGPEVDAALKAYAAEALKADLAARPEWASDLGPGDVRPPRQGPVGAGRRAQEAQPAWL